jgi:hypothetical protein
MRVALTTAVRGMLLAAAIGLGAAIAGGAPQFPSLSDREANDIAAEAYVYAYPLVLMEMTRRVMTNVARASERGAPINQFYHMRSVPDASFSDIVRPNADTLYSSMWFDVAKEPLIVSVPDANARYYLMPMLDMWTDVFAAPGKRTTGTRAQEFAVVGPDWKGRLPTGVAEIRAPTAEGWLVGRTQVDGKLDYPAVHNFQDKITAVPLSAYGKPYTPPDGAVDAAQDMSAPAEQVAKLDPEAFFEIFAEATRNNPPHANDYPVLARMARIGIEPGKPFDFANAPLEVTAALEAAPAAAKRRIDEAIARGSRKVNGWAMPTNPIGTYGTDYAKRAGIARFGLGANTLEDAFYPSVGGTVSDAKLDGANGYVLRFEKDQLPPARAFWSVSVYDERQLFPANAIGRYALGDRDALSFNEDGSLELYLQPKAPGKAREANWLPTPAEGPFSVTMRLYWPKPEATDGTWQPPPLTPAP